MAERTRDLVDVLRSAEAQRTASVAGAAPTAAAAARTRLAVRSARARRRALVVVGAAAAVAVVAAGAVVWSPRAAAPPAGPGPSTGAQVPGLPPLRQADESDVRGAPEGSALALWVQRDAPAPTDAATPAAEGGGLVAYLLLVRPDGEVLEIGPAPEGATMLTSWDRAAGTAVLLTEGEVAASEIDVVSGHVVGTDAEFGFPQPLSPDGTARAWQENADAYVERDGVEVRHDLPAVQCQVLEWADDATLLIGCPSLDPTTLRPDGGQGATTVLMDATTGAVSAQQTVTPDVPRPQWPAVRLDDGRLVAWMVRPQDDLSTSLTCPLRVDEIRGLESVPFAEIPSDALSYPGLVRVPGGLLASGTDGCEGGSGSPVLWSVDATGDVTVVLPAVESAERVEGLRSWVVGG